MQLILNPGPPALGPARVSPEIVLRSRPPSEGGRDKIARLRRELDELVVFEHASIIGSRQATYAAKPATFRGAALRSHARYCGEVQDVRFEEAQVVLTCLAGLAAREPKAAAEALPRPSIAAG
jgi:hypothetical protein